MNGSINDSAAQQQRDEKFMRMAINEARQALKREEVPIGAVVVAGDRVVGRGCAGAIAWSQAARVVWGADDPKRGYTTVEGLRLHPRTVVVRGVLAAECEALMKEFFKELR